MVSDLGSRGKLETLSVSHSLFGKAVVVEVNFNNIEIQQSLGVCANKDVVRRSYSTVASTQPPGIPHMNDLQPDYEPLMTILG